MKFKDNLAALVKVKTIVTLAVILVFAVLSVTGKIGADNVMIVVSSVISFYFGTQHEKSAAAGDPSAASQDDARKEVAA